MGMEIGGDMVYETWQGGVRYGAMGGMGGMGASEVMLPEVAVSMQVDGVMGPVHGAHGFYAPAMQYGVPQMQQPQTQRGVPHMLALLGGGGQVRPDGWAEGGK